MFWSQCGKPNAKKKLSFCVLTSFKECRVLIYVSKIVYFHLLTSVNLVKRESLCCLCKIVSQLIRLSFYYHSMMYQNFPLKTNTYVLKVKDYCTHQQKFIFFDIKTILV